MLGPSALGAEAAFLGAGGRARRLTGPLDAEGVGEAAPKPLERQLSVAGLGALVTGHHPHHRPEPGHHPRPLTGPERRRARDIEAHLDLGVGGVGVLAPGPPRSREPPVELVERYAAAPGDDQVVTHHLDANRA